MQKKARIVAGSGAQQMNGYGGVHRDGAGAASSCHRFANHERPPGPVQEQRRAAERGPRDRRERSGTRRSAGGL